MQLVSPNHGGKGIVVKRDGHHCKQYSHGLDKYLEIGKKEDAMSVFVDENNHIHWSKYPSLVFDGWVRT